MRMKNDPKFEEDLTCQFKIDMGNWMNLIRALENLKNVNFNELLLTKVIRFELKKVQRSYV